MSETKKNQEPANNYNEVLADVFYGAWEGLKTLLAWIFVIYAFLFLIVGGEFSISIKWENAVELWRLLNFS